ncbi:hypothetical protein SAMN05216436_11351 [bacterium A37T11]|nr:hypothetical protein SAMN05216436_11351 [bacterium A37T11]
MSDRIFRSWVPQQLDFWLLLILATFLSFSNGIPTTISSYIIGSQSAISSDISMASYAYYTGMTCAMPLVFRVNNFTSKKNILLTVILILLPLNFVLATASDVLSMVMASFIVGAVKIFGSVCIIGELTPILMPKGERYQLYCVYYPLAILIPGVSGLVAAQIADTYFWEMSFHFQNLLLFIGLIIIICMTKQPTNKRYIPLYQYDFFGSVLMAISLLLIAFFSTYGMIENWYHSDHILIGTVSAIFFLTLFLNRNFHVKRKIFDFSAFKNRALPVTLLVLFMLGIFYANTSLFSAFMGIIVPGNPLKSAQASNYAVWGYIVGPILTYFYFKQTKNCKYIFAFAGLCYLISNVWMYLLINPQTNPDLLFYPMFFRGMALIISYITAGVYLGGNVPVKAFLPSVTFLILVRSFLVPIVWANTIANWYYHRQLVNMTSLAAGMDRMDPLIVSRGSGITKVMQNQASLLAMRDIYGALNIIGIVIIILILVFPFHSSSIRRIFNWRDRAQSKELVQATV